MSRKTILLVEDNASDIELTKRALSKSHIANTIIVKEDGQEALDYLFNECSQNRGTFPTIIMLDIKLPKIDGLEVLRRIRADERTRRIPVIILTSSGEKEDIGNSYNLGANSYIRKPVDFNQFVEAVKGLGLYWLVINEASPF
ncbi:MAG: two-component system response regulator [Candidatus Cloacimonetes bacterium HGW-Cloacimonetes-3]|jgi:CheY-like chemotaxis protein|nr:MAG: two-component system response regulator [Candidatus Cloacimonetes bacterium HGW-Cloacimonetes-3]